MDLRHCTKADFDQIITNITEFWGSDRTLAIHHPMFIYEFGNTAYVICDDQKVAAYLFGFISQTEPTAYIHLVAVRAYYRRQKLANWLYDHFADYAREAGCTQLKAITTPTNATSIAFHQGIGFTLLGKPNANGIPVVSDYSGPNQERVVFIKPIG
jgi:ribosomal protein S18 acetylase RimI-like enzyme